MKKITSALTIFLLLLIIATPAYLFAKIGEHRKDIEKRLNSRTNGAYQYPEEEELREALELPYRQLFLLQPLGSKNAFYFKRSDHCPTTNTDTFNQRDLYGWELHIAYFKDISVIEFYQRHGDPMTFEEVKGLMKLISKNRSDALWKKANFVPYSSEQKLSESDPVMAELQKIIPKNAERFIFLEIPKEVLGQSYFQSTLQGAIFDDERRSAFENYSKILEESKKFSDARTAAGAASKNKGSAKNATENEKSDINTIRQSNRKTVIPFVGNSSNFVFGGVPPKNRTKDVLITGSIPVQADTSVGYNYELADGSIRALLYNNGIIFIDTKYDRLIRETMEALYEEQTSRREKAVEGSLEKF